MCRQTRLAPEPSRLSRALAAVRRWTGRSAWRALSLVIGLGLVAGLALLLGLSGPFWQQVAGGLVFFVLFFAVVSWFDDGRWGRFVAFCLFVAPTVALVFLLPPTAADFQSATGFVEARRSGWIPGRSGCMGVYTYRAGGETYHTLIAGDRCPNVLIVQYVVARPWRARRQPSGVGPPPPAPPPGMP